MRPTVRFNIDRIIFLARYKFIVAHILRTNHVPALQMIEGVRVTCQTESPIRCIAEDLYATWYATRKVS